jgi:hypothetical protein
MTPSVFKLCVWLWSSWRVGRNILHTLLVSSGYYCTSTWTWSEPPGFTLIKPHEDKQEAKQTHFPGKYSVQCAAKGRQCPTRYFCCHTTIRPRPSKNNAGLQVWLTPRMIQVGGRFLLYEDTSIRHQRPVTHTVTHTQYLLCVFLNLP